MNIVNKNDGDQEVIDFVVRALQGGKVIAYPTETVYGLGCDATNKQAVKKIYTLKGRGFDKQVLLLVSSLVMAKKYVRFNKAALELAKHNWPGALTLVLPTTELGNETFGKSSLGMRITSHPIAHAIVSSLGVPLVSTSANLTGEQPARSGQEVIDVFATTKHQPDLILDAGKLKKSKGSTIVDCTDKNLRIIRQGDVKLK